MADREPASYEAALAANGTTNSSNLAAGQKAPATSIPVASLTSKPLKHQQAMKDNSQASDSPPSGYYFNVAQKGKLILPTALWILLIVAGVSFLSLLASLNRTVDTLDTLVELEQEKEARLFRLHHMRHADDHEHGHRFHGGHDGPKPADDKHHSKQQQQQKEEPLAAKQSTWFDFPSWALLEPRRGRPADAQDALPARMGNVLDEIARQGGSLDGPEISGSLIITSSGGGGDLAPMADGGMIDSLMRQFMPMFAGLSSGPLAISEAGKESRPGKAEQAGESSAQAPLTISAKIENLNINLGDNVSAEKEKKPANEIDDAEKSIDSLVSKLMDQKSSGSAHSSDVDEVRPIIEPAKIAGRPRHPGNHRHRHHHQPSIDRIPQVSPLPGDLLPLGAGPFEAISFPFGPPLPLFVPDERPLPVISRNKHRHGLAGKPANSLNSLPDEIKHPHNYQPANEPQMIISIASNDPQADLSSLIGGHLHEMPFQTPDGPPPPPYELPVGSPISSLLDSFRAPELEPKSKKSSDEAKKIKDEAQWDMLSSDLANSLLQSFIQPPGQLNADGGFSGVLSPPSQSLVLVNGQPLAQGELQKLASQPSGDAKSSPPPAQTSETMPSTPSGEGPTLFGDLLGMIFDSALGSPSTTPQMVVDEAPERKNHADEEAEKMINEMKEKLEQTMSATNAKSEPDSQATSASPLTASIMPSTKTASENSESPADATEAIMKELIGNMFTSAQMGGPPARQEVGGGPPGGAGAEYPFEPFPLMEMTDDESNDDESALSMSEPVDDSVRNQTVLFSLPTEDEQNPEYEIVLE